MKKYIILLIIICLMSTAQVQATDIITSEKELYEQIANDCINFKQNATYSVNFKVNNLSLEKIRNTLAKKNQILGNNVNAFQYQISKNTVVIGFGYLLSKPEYEACIKQTKIIANQFPDDMTDYQKIKTTHDYLCNKFSYSYTNDGPYDALCTGLADCEGYAMTFQMIMDHAGIPCEYITGNSHAWNIVMVDGDWYNIDVTWDDAEYKISYDYFLKSAYDFNGHDINLKCSPINYNLELAQKYGVKNPTHSARMDGACRENNQT